LPPLLLIADDFRRRCRLRFDADAADCCFRDVIIFFELLRRLLSSFLQLFHFLRHYFALFLFRWFSLVAIFFADAFAAFLRFSDAFSFSFLRWLSSLVIIAIYMLFRCYAAAIYATASFFATLLFDDADVSSIFDLFSCRLSPCFFDI